MFANMRVLFIDDDPSVLRAVGRALDAEFEITQSPSIEDALGLIECGRRYDAILCDVDFGTGMSGGDFYDRLLAAWPDQAARVLFFSGSPFDDLAFMPAMAYRHVPKTTPIAELIERLHAIFRAPFAA